MKKLYRIFVCGLLMASSLNLFSKHKDRVGILNRSGITIYCNPNTGRSKIIEDGETACITADTSFDKLKSIEICSQDAQEAYSLRKEAIENNQLGPLGEAVLWLEASAKINAVSKSVKVASGQTIVVEYSRNVPVVKHYQTRTDYKKENPTAAPLDSCGQE